MVTNHRFKSLALRASIFISFVRLHTGVHPAQGIGPDAETLLGQARGGTLCTLQVCRHPPVVFWAVICRLICVIHVNGKIGCSDR